MKNTLRVLSATLGATEEPRAERALSMPHDEVKRIREMLTYRRPARSQTEEEFITRYIDAIPGVYADQYGNRILLDPDARVMISCHTDSVHRMDGRQRAAVGNNGVVSLARGEILSNCLGADDAAGVYAALRMIRGWGQGYVCIPPRRRDWRTRQLLAC